jgi:Protein of unknown function (DUF1573)
MDQHRLQWSSSRLAIAAGIAACIVFTPVRAVETKRPRLYVETRIVELGRVSQGDKVTAEFTLENRGDADLQIDSIAASCSCTVSRQLTPDELLVEPGETVNIGAVFDSKGRHGPQRKSITVLSNDPDEPRLQLFLTAEVVPLVEMRVDGTWKRVLRFGRIRAGAVMEHVIDVLPTEPNQAFEVTKVELLNPNLRYTSEPFAIDDRRGVKFTLYAAPDAQIGQLNSALEVSGKVGDAPGWVRVTLTGEIVGDLSFRPAAIKQLEPVAPENQLRPVSVRSQTGEPFEILSVDAGPNIEFDIKEKKSGAEYIITPRFKRSARPGPYGANMDIRTDVPAQPLIRVPLFANMLPYVKVYPAVVVLKLGDGGAGSERRVKLTASRGGMLELGAVTVDAPYATAEVTTDGPREGRSVKYVRVVAAPGTPRGVHETVVRIKTNIAAESEVAVPVTIIVP